jgi:hypothetical protein
MVSTRRRSILQRYGSPKPVPQSGPKASINWRANIRPEAIAVPLKFD